jgi:hypothetical protein
MGGGTRLGVIDRRACWVLAMLVGLACEGGADQGGGGDGGASGLQGDVCVARADDPHQSSTNVKEIASKGWFQCTTSPQDITLTVNIEMNDKRHWVVVATDHQPWAWPAVRRKYVVRAELPCRSGEFRTSARIAGHGDQGRYLESAWTRSKVITNPCGQRR